MKLLKFLIILNFCTSVSLVAQEIGRIPFFVFNNGVQDDQYDIPEKQVQLLKSLDYDGMEKKGLMVLQKHLMP
jgi:hypothetical protein